MIYYVYSVNLSEFINSYSEKGHKIPESVIWKVLIHLSTALKYLHDDLKIVHRCVV